MLYGVRYFDPVCGPLLAVGDRLTAIAHSRSATAPTWVVGVVVSITGEWASAVRLVDQDGDPIAHHPGREPVTESVSRPVPRIQPRAPQRVRQARQVGHRTILALLDLDATGIVPRNPKVREALESRQWLGRQGITHVGRRAAAEYRARGAIAGRPLTVGASS